MSEKIVQPPSQAPAEVRGEDRNDVPEHGLDVDSRDAIAGRLKQLYGGLVNEPMPDRFKILLDRLAGSESKS